MKKVNLLYLLLFTLLLLGTSSCNKSDDNSDNSKKVYNSIDTWIYSNMKDYYLWSANMPSAPDSTLAPDKFFASLLYTSEDRFSWIEENYTDLLDELNKTSPSEIGFEYAPWKAQNGNIYFEVLYVKKNTDAATKGLMRGDFITSVGGNPITMSNYSTILSGSSSYTFTVSKNQGSWTLSTPTTITVKASSNYAEDPILTAKVINGGTVGYLAYNFFANDNGDDTYNYTKELMDTLNMFVSKGISNLVLDLEYNSGGAVTTAQILASALVPNRNASNTFINYAYNSTLTAYLENYDYTNYQQAGIDRSSFIDKFLDQCQGPKDANSTNISRLGDHLNNHLYILTGEYTASASELIINGLNPYMNITLVGDTTYGKNVASTSIYEENNPKNKWGMQPIITKMSNSVGFSDYTKGFKPNYYANEYYDASGYPRIMKPLGDENEYLLSIALGYINGTLRSSVVKSATAINRKGAILPNKGRNFNMTVDNKHLPKISRIE